jgi:hypothetical protein
MGEARKSATPQRRERDATLLFEIRALREDIAQLSLLMVAQRKRDLLAARECGRVIRANSGG